MMKNYCYDLIYGAIEHYERAREGNKKHWSKEFDELFEFDGVIYKGQRHWKRGVKNGLVKRFIKDLLISQRQLLKKKVMDIKPSLSGNVELIRKDIVLSLLQSSLEDNSTPSN